MVWRTTLITISTCFLLGTTFTHWIADHNVLWRSPLTSDALSQSITYYSLLASAPPLLGWAYIAVGVLAMVSSGARTVKDWQGRGGEVLFDGGSVVLLAAIAYNQINEVYPTITLFPSPLPNKVEDHPLYPALVTAVRDLANDNLITAVMLTGVMLLQAGRYYSKPSCSLPPSGPIVEISPPTDTTPLDPEHERRRSLVAERSATPFRELSADEAAELNEVEEKAKGRRRKR